MITIFVGSSASGKSVISKKMVEDYGCKEIVSYTTREKRPGERNGVDYHFVSENDFKAMIDGGQFVEYEQYNQNRWYGTSIESIREAAKSDKMYVAVLTPSGLRAIKRHISEKYLVSVLVECDLNERVIRYTNRCKENFSLDDLDELCKRAHRDFGMLMGIANEVDLIVDNTDCDLEVLTREIVENVLDKFQERLENTVYDERE